MNNLIVHINNFPINIIEINGKYLPSAVDLARCANLDFLKKTDTQHTLFSLLLDERFSEAVRYVAYETDELSSTARKRIVRFFLSTIVCLLFRFSIEDEQTSNHLEAYMDFVSGINCTSYSSDQIVELIVSEGLVIQD